MTDRIDRSQWQRLGALFDQAIDLDAAAQAELLQTIEREDAELAQALVSLLAADARHHARTGEYRERVLQGTLDSIDGLDIVAGYRVGPYILRENLGQGGMGVVFRAERDDGQMRQEVAIKVIKLGMGTREVIARFDAERQALALMEHPHIARILDAGATDSGRPYFVMELVKGQPISSYCSERQLTIVQRLQLFEQVCGAVQHAHTKGIIHRDLKPTNVLVTTQDGQAFAKVIDFGIAKATSGRLTDKTLMTEQFLMMGTPLYMSPEQAAGSADIDTRTDIYALGVILYELLTDTTPIDSDSLRTAAHAEVQRIIREVDPPRPSVRLAQSATTAPGAATGHGIDHRALVKTVRGELDWIAMKAIEKDRARRYGTAEALAQDVRRFLAGDAVLAAPPGASYRMRKFIRRNKGTVAAGSMIAAALLAGIVAFAWQARIARQHADEVDQVAQFEADMLKQVDVDQAGRQMVDDMQAKLSASLAKAGVPASDRAAQAATLAGLMQHVNATDTARDLIDRTILKPAAATIDKQFARQPVVAATLDQVLASRYVDMGLYVAAMPLQQRALAIRRRTLGEYAPDTLESLTSLGALLDEQGKPAEAEPYDREALEKSRRIRGDDDPGTLSALNNLGGALQDEGKPREAEPYYRESVERRRRVLGNDNVETIAGIDNLGTVLQDEGKFDEAERYIREAVERGRRVLGKDNSDTLMSMNNLAELLSSEGKEKEAEPYLREIVERARRTRGENNPTTLFFMSNLGVLLDQQDKWSEAEPFLREAFEQKRRAIGEDNPDTVASMNALGELLVHRGKLAEAEPLLRESLAKSRSERGDGDFLTQVFVSHLSDLLLAQGKYAEAVQLISPNVALARKAFAGANGDRLGALLMHLGKADLGLGQFAAAQPVLLEGAAIVIKLDGPKDPYSRECAQAVIDLYTAWNAKEPGKGYDARAAEWKKKLDAMTAAIPARVEPVPAPKASPHS